MAYLFGRMEELSKHNFVTGHCFFIYGLWDAAWALRDIKIHAIKI